MTTWWPISIFWVAMSIPAAGAAQPITVDTISAMQPWPPHELFTFPRFSISGHTQVADRIYRDACIELLEVDPDTAKGSIFQVAWGDPTLGLSQRLNSLTWSFDQPLPQLLSIAFSGEGCGAYCEGFTVHYVYDLREGSRLQFDTLFTDVGHTAVDDTIRKQWVALVETHMRLITDPLQGNSLSAENSEGWNGALEMYRQCLLERAGQRPYVADFEPRDHGLRVYIARCSAHVDRDQDDLGEVFVDLPYEWLRPYLRPELASLFRE